jgi:undecaprenyl diphosphate synthase
MWVKRPLDLIIRSGGANLTSNFLPLQSGFARLYFLDELFNDVKLETVIGIMDGFNDLNRKFGD